MVGADRPFRTTTFTGMGEPVETTGLCELCVVLATQSPMACGPKRNFTLSCGIRACQPWCNTVVGIRRWRIKVVVTSKSKVLSQAEILGMPATSFLEHRSSTYLCSIMVSSINPQIMPLASIIEHFLHIRALSWKSRVLPGFILQARVSKPFGSQTVPLPYALCTWTRAPIRLLKRCGGSSYRSKYLNIMYI